MAVLDPHQANIALVLGLVILTLWTGLVFAVGYSNGWRAGTGAVERLCQELARDALELTRVRAAIERRRD